MNNLFALYAELLGWRSHYRLEGIGQCVLVWTHPILGEIVWRPAHG